jgi:hypothetical protein
MVVYESSGGLVEVAFALGLILGFFLIGFMAWFLLEIRKRNFRMYYFQLDDENKKEIMKSIFGIEAELGILSCKTNTIYFKALENQFHDLVSYLKRRLL